MTLSNVEETIITNYPSMRLKGYYKKWVKEVPLETFVIQFLQTNTMDYDTIDCIKKKVICKLKRRRSLGEIYLISKHYYPNIELKDIILILFSLVGQKTGWRYTYCNITNRKMFYYAANKCTTVERFSNDEFNNSAKYYQTITKNENK